jgi:signal transduction histidine kinase
VVVRKGEGNARVLAAAGRYGLAIGAGAAALGATSALVPVLGGPYFFVVFPAALVAGLIGGFGPGLACVAVHAAGAIWFLAEPQGSLAVDDPRTALRLGLVALNATIVAVLGARLRIALSRERRLRAEAEGEAAARTVAEQALREAHDRLSALQALTAELSAARSSDEIVAALFRLGVPLLGAEAGIVAFRSGESALAMRLGGPTAEPSEEPALVPLEAHLPAAEVARTGHALWLGAPGDVEARFPALAGGMARAGLRACACVPLWLEGEPAAVLGVSFADARPFDLRERALVASVAQLCAQALSRARRHEAEERARARAEAAEEEARRVAAFQDQVLAVVGHDLRTPLSAITMAVGLARQRAAAGDDRTASALDRIARSARRMHEIIRDLLDLARARQGLGLAVAPAPVSAREVCAQAVAELQQVFPDRAIRLSAPDEARISADGSRLHQAVSNLVGNALQHGDPGTAVTVDVAADGDGVTIRVANRGEPIAEERLAAIFEPFRRGDSARAGDGESLGLGLFIVREIARAHGGSVTVSSDAATGTVFELTLPRALAAGADAQVTSSRH